MIDKKESQAIYQNEDDKELDQLYRAYQYWRDNKNIDLVKDFNQVDKSSSDFIAYQKQRDETWDALVAKAKHNTGKIAPSDGMKLTKWSTYFMLAGLLLGLLLHPLFEEDTIWVNYFLDGLRQFGAYFIETLKYAAIPLVIVSLIDGIISVDKSNTLWRISRKSLFLYFITTFIATAMAIVLTVIIGVGINQTPNDYELGNSATVDTIINGLTSPLVALSHGNMIPVILLAIFIAMAIRGSGSNVSLIHQAVHQLSNVMQTMLGFILRLVPAVIFALTVVTMTTLGSDIIFKILAYFLTVIGVLLLHVIVSYSALLHFAKLNPLMFFRKMLAVKFFALGTSSSNATIPINIKNAENRLGISQSISSFVIPLGATVNMDGTAIMLGVASVFAANLFGIELSLFQYLMLLIVIIFASVAIAGIPKGSLAMLSLILTTAVGLEVEDAATLIGIIMAVDHLLDMLRTAVNVTGDATIACVIARSENELNDKVFDDPNACCIIEHINKK